MIRLQAVGMQVFVMSFIYLSACLSVCLYLYLSDCRSFSRCVCVCVCV